MSKSESKVNTPLDREFNRAVDLADEVRNNLWREEDGLTVLHARRLLATAKRLQKLRRAAQ